MLRYQPVYNVGMVRMTRREWAVALAVSGVPAAAQTVSPGPKGSAGDMLAQARRDVRREVDELRKFPLPPATEPAFVFEP
jgi:hypothetical protein